MPSLWQPVGTTVEAPAALPDPGQATSLDDLVERLRLLKVWAGNPSYEWITSRVNAVWTAAGRPGSELVGKTTVVDCFRLGRRRLNPDLVVTVVQALHPDVGYAAQWWQALQVVGGQARSASQVRVQDWLPPDLVGFTGRTAELDWLRRAVQRRQEDGGAVVISAIAGMAGVGKTKLTIHAGHLLAREEAFGRVLFVNLRGFHPDPGQLPAEPSAVLDGFLRLLGASGHQIPHGLAARAAEYRRRLAGTRTLVVLDNAADADQVRPLLPETPGCPVLVNTRRSLTSLRTATHLTLDVFTTDEAVAFLTQAVSRVPAGPDPYAAARIARRCGNLPLALGLIAGHIRTTPGWTLTDHADRLDERRHSRHLDTGVDLALDLSYQHIPADRRRLLRLLALHPGQDLDSYAAAALYGGDLAAVGRLLDGLCRDHLLQQTLAGRYTLHDLVRAYASDRAGDEDPPPSRRAALTRMFDYYLAAAATAMNMLYAAEAHRRPYVSAAGTCVPAMTDPDAARSWLDTERPTLVAVAVHAATQGWPAHSIRLSTTLYRYLDGGYFGDALSVHGHASRAARSTDDPIGHADALSNLGATHLQLSQYRTAGRHLRRALYLFRQASDPVGQANALTAIGGIEQRLSHYQASTGYYEQALALSRQAGDQVGEARALNNLGINEQRQGRFAPAADHYRQALALYRKIRHLAGEAGALNGLGSCEGQLDRYKPARRHLHQALSLFRQLGDRTRESWTLDSLGTLHLQLGQLTQAAEYYHEALAGSRETGDRITHAWALNGLGEIADALGRPTEARTHHTDALTIAVDIADREQQARAHTGLARAHHALNQPTQARQQYQHALTLYTELGMPEADAIRAHLTTGDGNGEVR